MRNLYLQILILALTTTFTQLSFAQTKDDYRSFITKERLKNAKAAASEQNEKLKSPASININQGLTAEELIKERFISGGCFDVTNITYTGNDKAIGEFSNGNSSIGIEDGIILSSGNITNAYGPNTSNARSTGHNDLCNDADLLILANGATNRIYDCAILEFDFTPTTDMVSFEYAFASEEYCEFAGDEYNDVFGFFISGPGINGPYVNNAINVATLPGTSSAVSINTVNHFLNEEFYVPNEREINAVSCFKPFEAVALDDIEYDGFTVVLTATAEVMPCQTYHIRLAIGDGEDAIYDSAVFLKANSFNAGGTAAVAAYSPISDSNLVYESCNDAYFLFERTSDDLEEDVTINFQIDGASTAQEGIDFANIPNSIVIPAGEMEFLLPIDVLSDDLQEGNESLIIELDNACSCTVSTTELIISEAPPIQMIQTDFELCENETFVIQPVNHGALQNLTYEWSNGATSPTLESLATTNTIYSVTVSGECGQTAEAEYPVNVNPAPVAEIDGTIVLCDAIEEGTIQVELEGAAPWNIIYSIDGLAQNAIEVSDVNFEIPVSEAGIYTLESVESGSCIGEAKGTVLVQRSDFETLVTTESATCTNNGMGSILLETTGSSGPFEYTWNGNFGNTSLLENIEPDTYDVTITDNLACTQTTQVEVANAIAYPEGAIETPQEITCINTTVTLNGSVSTSGNNNTLFWSSPDGNILSGENSLLANVNQAGNYTLTITNDENGCSTELSTIVQENTVLPQAEAAAMDELTCTLTETELNINTFFANDITYEWSTSNGNILSGESTENPTINSPGNYQVVLTNTENGCTNTASVTVTQNLDTPTVTTGQNLELTCSTTEVNLQALVESDYSTDSYWMLNDKKLENSEDNLSYPVSLPGTYLLVVTNQENGCSAQDALIVIENTNYPTLMQTDRVVPACKGDGGSIHISHVEGGEAPYMYSIDGGTNFFSEGEFHDVQAGAYDLTVQDINGCELVEAFVLPDGNEPSLGLTPLVELSLGDDHKMQPQINLLFEQIDSIAWFPTEGLSCSDCLQPTVQPLNNSSYSLTIVDENGCSASAQIALRVSVEKDIYIPNAFSPLNEDGTNDVFQLYAKENLVSKVNKMLIYDRWGNNLYEATDFIPNARTGWNGRFRNKALNPGVYLYFFEVELINGNILTFKGDVTLVN